MKYIIGSGLIAFIAKTILPEYEIIPTGKSRYYQFPVATCDDYILCHKDIDDFMKEVVPAQLIPVFFKRALSYSGQLIFGNSAGFIDNWLNKVYGQDRNPHAATLTKLDSFVYSASAIDVFNVVEDRCKKHFREFITSGNKLKSIDTENRVIHTAQEQIPYDHIINTVPLDTICNICGIEHDLQSKDLHTFVVETEDLDFEGASELLVVDENIDFFKCTRVGRQTYQFYSTEEIINLPAYLSLIVNNFNVLSATMVHKALPIGKYDMHKDLEQFGITCVGSNAQWDDMMDVSSCIRRLMRISNDRQSQK